MSQRSQQIFILHDGKSDPQFARERIVRFVWSAELRSEPVEGVSFAAQRHPETMHGKGVCLFGLCPPYPESAEVWAEDGVWYFVSTPEYRELDNTDGEPVVLEWYIFAGHTTLQLLREVQELMEKELKIPPPLVIPRTRM